MERIYEAVLREHFRKERKMALVVGPRQVGKTTTARAALPDALYLNWDNVEHRELVLAGPSRVFAAAGGEELRAVRPGVIFDEIHKFDRWKTYLKGFYDTYGERIDVCVTGSARLDIYKHGGDSLMGRYFLYHMHPLSVREIVDPVPRDAPTRTPAPIDQPRWDALIAYGGYPEPFLRQDSRFYTRWKRLRAEQLFDEDVRDLAKVTDIARLKVLAARLARSVGGTLNYSNLATDIMVAVDTIRRWIDTLESMYFCFRVRPYVKDVARAILKEPKVYLWDWGLAETEGARTENLVAQHLLKAVQYLNDLGHGDLELFYVRDKSKREVDFLVVRDGEPWILVEAKTGDDAISQSLRYFQQALRPRHAFQLTRNLPYADADCFAHTGPLKVPLTTFLSQLPA